MRLTFEDIIEGYTPYYLTEYFTRNLLAKKFECAISWGGFKRDYLTVSNVAIEDWFKERI